MMYNTYIMINPNAKRSLSKTNTTSENHTSIFMTVGNKVRYSARYALFCIIRIVYFLLYTYGFIALPPEPITISSRSEDYIQRQKTRFLESYTRFSSDDINSNIDKCFYDKKLYSIAVENADNELETAWKRRILFENTPRGSVIMHYDAYKQGFVYYCDSSNIPYFVINAVIMKYVITFRCRDFFVDDQYTLNNIPSPLLTIHNSTDTDISNKSGAGGASSTSTIPGTPSLKTNAFAKLKNYNTISAKASKLSDNNLLPNNGPQLPETHHYTRNKVIYSGKICNFKLLQKPSKPQKQSTFTSTLSEDLLKNSSVQSEVFTYKDYKKMRQTAT